MKRNPKFIYVALNQNGEVIDANTNRGELIDLINSERNEPFMVQRFSLVSTAYKSPGWAVRRKK